MPFNKIAALGLALAILPWSMAVADGADDGVSSLQKGAHYETARLGLFIRGWRAGPSSDPGTTAAQRCGARVEICNAYPETESCAGTGLGQCAFRFVDDNGRHLRVVTVGEALTDLVIDSSGLE